MLQKLCPIAGILLFISLFGCNEGAKKPVSVQKDTSFDELSLCRAGVIEYEIKTVKAVGVDPNNRGKIISEVHIKYPELKCANDKLQDAVKAYISNFIKNILKDNMNAEDTAKAQTINTAAQAFVRSCKSNIMDQRKEDPDMDQVWYCDVIGNIEMQSGSFFTLRFKYSSYTGGAHGDYGEDYSTFNINTGQQLGLSDIVLDIEKFKKLAELRFKQVNGLEANTKLTEDEGFLFENNAFYLSTNFGLTSDGLILYYLPYQVAPFSFGSTILLFKYNELIDYLNPNLFEPAI